MVVDVMAYMLPSKNGVIDGVKYGVLLPRATGNPGKMMHSKNGLAPRGVSSWPLPGARARPSGYNTQATVGKPQNAATQPDTNVGIETYTKTAETRRPLKNR